jgi:hypothetical protein
MQASTSKQIKNKCALFVLDEPISKLTNFQQLLKQQLIA